MTIETNDEQSAARFLGHLLFSYAIFVFAFVIDQTFRWTNHFDGLRSGLIQGAILGIGWCVIYVIPWSLIFLWLHWRGKWTRSLRSYILAPSWLILIFSVAGLILWPPTAKRRFKEHAKVEMPAEISGLSYKLCGGGIADIHDTFYFRTTPQEVERLIREMGLIPEKSFSDLDSGMISQLPNAPDPRRWDGATQFNGNEGIWFYTLLTDSSKTEVYVSVMQI